MIRVAPTEPDALKRIGTVTLLPERFGVDVLIPTRIGLVGIQRKQFPSDFLSSVHDGRLQKEFGQMKILAHAFLLLEGRPTWTSDGKLANTSHFKWTVDSMTGFLLSLQIQYNVGLLWTEDTNETILVCKRVEGWFAKTSHNSMRVRPRPSNPWQSRNNEDWQVWMLQGVPGIGPGTAEAICKHFGRLPLQLTVGEVELRAVPGVGKKTANDLLRYLG